MLIFLIVSGALIGGSLAVREYKVAIIFAISLSILYAFTQMASAMNSMTTGVATIRTVLPFLPSE